MKNRTVKGIFLSLALIVLLTVSTLLFVSCGKKPTEKVTILYESRDDGILITGYDGVLAEDTEFKIPSTIDGKEVIAIADNAFAGRSDLVRITLPSTVKAIGKRAFKNCKSLEYVNIPENVTNIDDETFYGCVSLTEVLLPEGITSISDSAYTKCGSIEHLTAPSFALEYFDLSALKSLNIKGDMEVTAGMLASSKKLETLTIPYIGAGASATENTHFGYIFGAADAEGNSDAVPSSLTKVVITGNSDEGAPISAIDSKAFFGCASIKNIILPNSVTSIGRSAFENCAALTKLTIPALVTQIGASAFANTDISAATIPAGVKEIGEKVFYGCDNLATLTIGKGVEVIGSEAFVGCTSLTSLYVNNIEQWLSFDFESCLESPLYYAGALYIGGRSAENIVVPESITKIGNNAFYRCTNVKSITLHDGITEIGDYAFAGCTSLAEIKSAGGDKNTLPENLTSIGHAAFSNCQGLTEITIPASVTSLGEYAFNLCTSLKTLNLNANVTELGSSTFRGAAIVTLNVTSPITACATDAFADVNRIQTAIIPLSVAKVINTKNLRSVRLTDADKIPDALFYRAENLTEAYLPESVTEIGDNAFFGCAALRTLDFGVNSKLQTIGVGAFMNCKSLTSFTVPEGVSEIGNAAFGGCVRLREVRNLSTALSIAVGEQENGGIALSAYAVLTDKDTPSAYAEIGNYLFYRGDNEVLLVGYFGKNSVITLPASFEGRAYTIADYAFSNSSIRVITIPSLAVECEANAFANMTSIIELEAPTWILSKMPPSAKASVEILNITDGNEVNTATLSGFKSLRKITLNASVSEVSAYDIAMLPSLEAITVDSDNTVYFSTDGHLYKKGANGNVLVKACPMTADYFTLDTTVVEIGDYAFYNCDLLTSVYIEDGSVLNRIGSYAFYDCDILYSLELPSTVAVIGNYAFGLCDYISELEFTKENAYYTISGGCLIEKATKTVILGFGEKVGDLRVVTIPSDAVKIADYAIAQRVTLQGIIIPAGVEISEYALGALPALESIIVAEGNTEYKVVGGCLIRISDGKLILAQSVVYNAETGKTEGVKIPADVKIIGATAFSGNTAITSITIPDSVTSIEDGAFDGCTSLTNVTAPAWALKYFDKEAVTTLTVSSGDITSDTLAGFVALESFTVGDGVNSIAEGSFKDSTLLSKINVGKNNTKFKVSGGCLIDISSKTVITAIGGIDENNATLPVIPGDNSVVRIGEYAFAGKALTSVVIPGTVTEIAENAFENVTTLVSVTIPAEFVGLVSSSAVTTLTVSGGNALTKDSLKGFDALKSISISSSVSSIESGAFVHCPALVSIAIQGNGGAYAVNGGCLIHTATKTLVAGVGTASVPLDGSVSAIASYAFAGNTVMVEVAIPAGVSIGESAFLGCTSLKRVFYAGSDWQTDSATASVPDGVTVYSYSENQPTTAGDFWYIKDGKVTIWW